ncbi:uncharacterized protein [Triticum aestivum]|uniref:uncharacterized protein isoform X2 n=1 Tax=Triticum aestivum TaxID=4565 RepID=UPI001D0293CA|nr:uncharacterized protein LOC123047200 isoform X2 [Triticum aestivum]
MRSIRSGWEPRFAYPPIPYPYPNPPATPAGRIPLLPPAAPSLYALHVDRISVSPPCTAEASSHLHGWRMPFPRVRRQPAGGHEYKFTRAQRDAGEIQGQDMAGNDIMKELAASQHHWITDQELISVND